MLLERNREVQLLTGLLADAGADGRVVLVHGEAGVGKTSLVREFVERVGDDAHCLMGACDALSTPHPLAPFHDMARSEPHLAAPLSAGDRPGLFGAALELLMRPVRPTVMVIEDVQWAGGATLDAITYLGRRIADANALLVLTYRDEEIGDHHPFRRAIGSIPPESITRIELGCLSAEAVGMLLDHTGHDVATVMELTDGNPLFVAELAASPGEEIPASVADAVLGRAAQLSDRSRQVLRTLSVVPVPLSLGPTLPAECRLDELLAEDAARGLLEFDDTVRFRHELARRTIEASLTPVERVMANRYALTALPPDTDPAQLAHHALEADDPDALLRHVPVAAAHAFDVESYREAYQLYRALEPHLDLLEPAERGDLLDRLGQAAMRSYVPDEENLRVQRLRVDHHTANPTTSGDRRAAAAALADLATILTWTHRSDEATQAASQALELLGSDAEASDRLPALVALSHIAMMDLDFDEARMWAERALAAADDAGDDEMAIRTLVNLATVEDLAAYPGGARLCDEAAERAIEIGVWWHARRAWQNHAWIAVEQLDLPAATDYVQRVLDAREKCEAYRANDYAVATHTKLLEATGEWGTAEHQARGLSDHPAIFVSLPIIGAIEARTGRPARPALDEVWELAVETASVQRTLPAGAALAEYAWITDDHEIPLDAIRAELEAGLEIVPDWRSTGLVALWLWKLGVLDAAPPGIAEPYRLLIDGESGEAAEMFAAIGCPYDRAIALSHGPDESRVQALEELESLGATAVASKLRRQLRAEGVRLPRGRARSTRSNVAGLTRRQSEVLELMADGLTNPEIADRLYVSPRTVEHHVSAILAKLDVATREDAVRTARSRHLLAS